MKKPIRVLMLCAAGMSSSLVCSSIENAAAERDIEITVDSTPSMTYKEMNLPEYDLILVAPQVRGQMPEVQAYVAEYELPVVQIGFQEYGLVKGEAILESILNGLGK